MTEDYWALQTKITNKTILGQCYCKELKVKNLAFSLKPDPKEKCIFCFGKTKEGRNYDPDFATKRLKDRLKDLGEM